MVARVLDRRGDCLAVIYVSLAGSSIFAQANAASNNSICLRPQEVSEGAEVRASWYIWRLPYPARRVMGRT